MRRYLIGALVGFGVLTFGLSVAAIWCSGPYYPMRLLGCTALICGLVAFAAGMSAILADA